MHKDAAEYLWGFGTAGSHCAWKRIDVIAVMWMQIAEAVFGCIRNRRALRALVLCTCIANCRLSVSGNANMSCSLLSYVSCE